MKNFWTQKELSLTGQDIRAMMRANNKTIRGVAEQFNLTLKRVRAVREHGVRGDVLVSDWLEILLG